MLRHYGGQNTGSWLQVCVLYVGEMFYCSALKTDSRLLRLLVTFKLQTAEDQESILLNQKKVEG